MKLRLNQFWKKQKTSKELTFEQITKILFLLVPYIKLIKKIKSEYKSDSNTSEFQFVIENLISQIDANILYEVFSIITGKTIEEIKREKIGNLILLIPKVIRDNHFIDFYFFLKQFGLFE